MRQGSEAIGGRRRLLRQLRNAVAGFGAVFLMISAVALAQTPPSSETPRPVASPVASAVSVTANADLGEIVWARDIEPGTNAPIRRATGFVTTDPAIHAVIPVIRILEGTVVSATWSHNGEPVPALDASVTADRSYENGWIAFSLTRPEEQIWPTGTYGIAIFVNGVEALAAEVLVQVPPA